MNTNTHDERPIGRAVRLAGGQIRLAEAVGCSQAHISKLVHGKVRLTEGLAIRIEYATGVSRRELMPDVPWDERSSVDANDSDPRAVSTRRTHEYDRRHEHGRRQADQGDVEPV